MISEVDGSIIINCIQCVIFQLSYKILGEVGWGQLRTIGASVASTFAKR